MTPEHVQGWIDFLATVKVDGPIPITFRVVEDALGVWILESTMLVPDRAGHQICGECKRAARDLPIVIQNELPRADDPTPKADVIRQRVLGHYQHEALENIFIAGERTFDPHAARWYSNLVADWRFNR